MNIINIIEKKRDKKLLNKNEIDFFIRGILDESIADYQTSSLLMAIFLNGLNDEETKKISLSPFKKYRHK